MLLQIMHLRQITKMSLKIFHLVFIAASVLLMLGLSFWSLNAWWTSNSATWLLLTFLAVAGGGMLIIYANRFLQKVRKLGIVSGVITTSLLLPTDVLACTVCLGNTDSMLRSGMNMGILVLLGVTGCMLLGFSTFFIYLARRARLVQTENAVLPVSYAGSKLRIHTKKGSI